MYTTTSHGGDTATTGDIPTRRQFHVTAATATGEYGHLFQVTTMYIITLRHNMYYHPSIDILIPPSPTQPPAVTHTRSPIAAQPPAAATTTHQRYTHHRQFHLS
jgi:hypothetical protein